MARKYTSISIETTLSATISATATSLTVASVVNLIGDVTISGGDQFTIAIDPDTINEEILFVTAANTGTNILTVIRGRAGTTGVTHSTGATVKHVLTGEDMTYFETEALNALDKTDVAAKGDLFAGTANDAYGILTVGVNERRLVADSAQTTGLKYVADTTNYAIAAKGNLLVGTAADTLQAVTVGSNGATLVADSTATPGVAWSATEIGKNVLINGNCAVNQRGNTTSTLTTSAKFSVDRFFARRSSGSSGASYEILTATTLTSLPNGIRIQRTAADVATDILITGQTVETANSIGLQGKAVTFSFWARKGADFSAASDALQVRVYTGTGTDETGLGSAYTGTASPINSNATLTTSWQRFTFTATLATDATQVQVVTQYVPVGTAGAADYFDVTGFQLEVGSVATPFSLAGGGNRETELNLCRRYYERWTSLSGNMRIGNGYAISGTQARITAQFKTSKRVGPTGGDNVLTALVDTSNNTLYTMTSYSLTEANAESITMTMNATSASFTAGEMIELATSNTIGAYHGWNSEIA
jgi:hypothetical protein